MGSIAFDFGGRTGIVADAVARTGRVDVIVNNAGLLRDNVLWKISDED